VATIQFKFLNILNISPKILSKKMSSGRGCGNNSSLFSQNFNSFSIFQIDIAKIFDFLFKNSVFFGKFLSECNKFSKTGYADYMWQQFKPVKPNFQLSFYFPRIWKIFVSLLQNCRISSTSFWCITVGSGSVLGWAASFVQVVVFGHASAVDRIDYQVSALGHAIAFARAIAFGPAPAFGRLVLRQAVALERAMSVKFGRAAIGNAAFELYVVLVP
jgi:hypothetical protein